MFDSLRRHQVNNRRLKTLNNSNQTKSAQLGMPWGTANAILRKAILYKYIKLAGDHICYKCKLPIDTVDELSIEHKTPWLYGPNELFWNLDNVAFSHYIVCNKTDRRSIGHDSKISVALRKQGPEGTAWCTMHKVFMPIEKFSKHTKRWNGVRTLCKEHQHYYRS